MASYKVLEATPIYYLIEVSFGGHSFRQLLASALVNGNLQDMLQGYADKYEEDWLAMQDSAVNEESSSKTLDFADLLSE